jgi:lipoprotein-anchoring transpeptidase ErfK/SrfK
MRAAAWRGWIAVGALGLLVSACSAATSTAAHPGSPGAGSATPSPALGPPKVTVTPTDGSTAVGLDEPITVTAANASISAIHVDENGASVSLAGVDSSGGQEWQYEGGLDLDATYTVSATATNAAGNETTASTTFSTITSAKRLLTSVQYISNGAKVGVGMPIDLHFNTPIPAADQYGIIAHIAVISDPSQPGGWYWVDAQDVHYRPENYWQSGTQVTVDADLNGVDAGNGYWGLGNWSESFSIGPEHVTVVNTQTRTMQVYDGDPSDGGTLLYTWATNTGKPGFYTIDGTLVVLYHTPVVDMESCPTFHTAAACTPGGSEYYNEDVYDDTAVSTDGYFIHAAPWVCGVSDLTCDLYPYGDTNSSHGCINLSTDHAVIYYSWSQVGDVVEVTGSPKEAAYSDGEGDWQTPWSDYLPGGEDVPATTTPAPSAPSTSAATPTPASVAGP